MILFLISFEICIKKYCLPDVNLTITRVKIFPIKIATPYIRKNSLDLNIDKNTIQRQNSYKSKAIQIKTIKMKIK